jgi:hypothetical protein
MYDDYRAQMHPRVAQTVPGTPEATAILAGERVKPMAFGGLVTKFVELGTVEATSMEAVKAGVSATLGIDEAEFSERLADSRLIDSDTAWHWEQNYERRGEAQLRADKEVEVKAHFDGVITERVGDTHLDKIQPRIDELGTKVAELEAQVADFEAQDLPFRAMPAKMLLQRRKPELEALEASTYAISLTDLVEVLKQDKLINAHGEKFAKDVVDGFAGWLNEVKILPETWWVNELYSGDTEYLEDDALAQMQDTWLSQADVALLSRAYAGSYYHGLGKDVPGRAEMEALPNPVRDALIVSDDERAAFFASYPLANGMQPRY